MFGTDNWKGVLHDRKKIEDLFICFDRIHECDGRMDRHSMTT